MTCLEIRDAVTAVEPWVTTYGTIDAGLETMRVAWPSLTHVFAVRRLNDFCSLDNEAVYVRTGPRCPLNLLVRKPVDLLIVEQGHIHLPPTNLSESNWETLVKSTPLST